MKQEKLTIQIYLLMIGKLKNRQSIYKEIKKNGTEGWASEIFDLLLSNDLIRLQEISKELINYDNLLKMGVSVSKLLKICSITDDLSEKK